MYACRICRTKAKEYFKSMKWIYFVFCAFCFGNLTSAFIDVDVSVTLQSNGFHRLLYNNVTIYGNISACAFLLKQNLNEHVYVIPRELDALKEDNILITKLSNKVDTESISRNAKPFVVWMYQKEPILHNSMEFHSMLAFSLPIHVRYHDPKKGGGSVRFIIPTPSLYVNCSTPTEQSLISSSVKPTRISCSAYSANLCDWILVSGKLKSRPVEIEIPVGNTDHLLYVMWTTSASIIIGAFLLIYTLRNTLK